MLHRADGGPRPVNLDLALYVDELQDGGSSIMFGRGEWVTVRESLDEIMELSRESAQDMAGAGR
jgi:hypothetical protein